MGYASFLVPLLTFVDPGKGDLPAADDAAFRRQTIPPCQIAFSYMRAHRRPVERTAPAPVDGELSSVQTI
jgi:hypothetical protein